MQETDEVTRIADRIMALERAALDRWGAGDPSGYLELSAPDVTYFDPFQERRVDGLDALTDLYEPFRGNIKIDRDELIDPCVQVIGDAAILTFNYVSESAEGELRWNCTEVYSYVDGDWKIAHTHWSFTQPAPAAAEAEVTA
jgi:ketosteroid isomerase-like protein